MSKTIIQNTREHDIVVAVCLPNKEITSVTVPAAHEEQVEGETKAIPGEAAIEDEVLELAKEKEVIQFWFAEGWLRVKSGGGAAKSAKAAEAPVAPAKNGGTKAPWNTDK